MNASKWPVLLVVLSGCEAQLEEAEPAVDASEIVLATGGELKRGVWLVPDRPVIEYRQIGDELVFDGDMQLDPSEVTELADGEDEEGVSRAALVADTPRGTWPNGVIPFVFDASVTSAMKARVRDAMELWEAKTSLKFVPRTGQGSWLTVRRGSSDYATIGRVGGKQFLTIRAEALTGVIVHELGHTIGLRHEHARPDRDKHIKVLLANVRTDSRGSYAKHYGDTIFNAYDMGSIMHYCRHTFANSSRPTMTKLDGSAIPHNWIRPTARDYAGVNVLYDEVKPHVALGNPAAGATLAGVVTLTATASDNARVTKVQFLVDGDVLVGDAAKPYSASWDTRKETNGTHTVSARAYDSSGNFATTTRSVTVSNGCTTPTQLIGNGGFEVLSGGAWTASRGVIDDGQTAAFPAHSGKARAWLGGYGEAHTDKLSQAVTVPTDACSAKLTFFLRVISDEIGTAKDDTLKVTLRAPTGEVVATLGTFSNLNEAGSYALKTFDLKAWKGQPLVLHFAGVENATLRTSFLVDDVQLEVVR